MTNLFTHSHQQLLSAQCSGLSGAWARAAQDAARCRHGAVAAGPDSASGTDLRAATSSPWSARSRVTSPRLAVALLAVVLGLVLKPETKAPETIAAAPAPQVATAH